MTHSSAQSKEDVAKTLGIVDSSGRTPARRRWWIWVVLLVGVLAAWSLWNTFSKTDPPRYVTQPVRRGNLVVTVSATGTLEPLKKVDVGIEVSGTIKSVEADYNDRVKVGQILARLDTTRLEAQAEQNQAALEAARAKVFQAQASVEESEAQLARFKHVRELSGGKMPSQNEFDTAKANLARHKADEASAKASVAQAQAALDVVRTDISKAVIHSPINGVVLKRSVEPGQTVAASFQAPTLFTLAEDLTQMELQVDVDEADVGNVREGQRATFTVDAYPDRAFPASITQVRFGSQTVEGVVTYKAVLRVDNSSLALRPGMTATAVITVSEKKDTLLVPNAALRFSPPQTEPANKSGGGGLLGALLPRPPPSEAKLSDDTNSKSKEQRVWVLRDNQLVAVTITKGATDGVMTEVVGGTLEPPMAVVTDLATAK